MRKIMSAGEKKKLPASYSKRTTAAVSVLEMVETSRE